MLIAKIIVKINLLFSDLKSEFRIWRKIRFPKNNEPLDILLQSVSDYKKNILSTIQKKDIDLVEQSRQLMLKSDKNITKQEYGSGSKVFENNASEESISSVCRIASKKKSAALVLYHLLRNQKPEHAVELGTCLGISAAYQGVALKANGKGKLITIEGSPGRAIFATENVHELGLEKYVEVIQGRFQDVLEHQLQKLPFVDFAFIDGHHQEDATLKYYQQLLPWFKKGGIMVFDDIFWSAGMNRAWQTIKKSGNFSAVMEYKGMGFVITD